MHEMVSLFRSAIPFRSVNYTDPKKERMEREAERKGDNKHMQMTLWQLTKTQNNRTYGYVTCLFSCFL